MQFPAGYPEVLCDIATCIQQTLAATLPPPQADDLAIVVADGIRRRFGGGLVYIPKAEAFLRAHRDAAIMREFTGNNHRDISRRYGITLSQVYDILARCRKAGASRG